MGNCFIKHTTLINVIEFKNKPQTFDVVIMWLCRIMQFNKIISRPCRDKYVHQFVKFLSSNQYQYHKALLRKPITNVNPIIGIGNYLEKLYSQRQETFHSMEAVKPTPAVPLIGLGTWLATEESELETALDHALDLGYRHIDTAWIYGNEHIIGRTLKKWLDSGKLKREDLFVVSKLPICALKPDLVSHYLDLSLKNLQLSYLDLYLIHVPFGVNGTEKDPLQFVDGKIKIDRTTDLVAVWKSMEEQVRAGKTKLVGLSNFDEDQVERIMRAQSIPPSCLQVEMHIYLQQRKLREVCDKHGIQMCAYSPLGSPGRGDFYKTLGMTFTPPGILNEPVVKAIAEKHGKSVAQICLRFWVQQGVAVIPKSTNRSRLHENLRILDFKLDQNDMKSLEALDQGYSGRTLDFSFFPGIEDHPEFPKHFRI